LSRSIRATRSRSTSTSYVLPASQWSCEIA
jgi:hypothetical protein